MLLSNDPFRDFDNLLGRLAASRSGTEHVMMPMDAYRRGDDLWIHVDLPGVDPDSIDISIERNVMTVAAQRTWTALNDDHTYLAERPRGSYRRQMHLGDSLDTDHIEADYHEGVLTVRIPVAEQAKPRKIEITSGAPAIDVTATKVHASD